jgi:hypothetical protein
MCKQLYKFEGLISFKSLEDKFPIKQLLLSTTPTPEILFSLINLKASIVFVLISTVITGKVPIFNSSIFLSKISPKSCLFLNNKLITVFCVKIPTILFFSLIIGHLCEFKIKFLQASSNIVF